MREKKKTERAVAFFAADRIDGGGESAAGEHETSPRLHREDLLADSAAGLAGEFEEGVENQTRGKQRRGRNDHAAAVNGAVMRGHANLARGDWQMNPDQIWTGAIRKSFGAIFSPAVNVDKPRSGAGNFWHVRPLG